jgi:phage terminase large subunit GpA-like protein
LTSSADNHDAAREALRRLLRRVIAETLKPTSKMTLPEWADEYRKLSLSSGAVGGKWETSRVEVARGPMMAVTEPGVRIISAMTCTQLMKTSLLENVIGYHAHLDPCPMLLVQPKDEAVDTFSKERLAPMVQVTPVLSELMGERATRRSDDTLRFKRFPGGFLALASAGSPTNLAMRAIRIVLMDEVDKYETTREGDPIALAEERMATFATNRLSIRACSPTWEETSRIYAAFLDGDQRRPYCACPHCGHEQVLDFFGHVQWGKDDAGDHDPHSAAVYCQGCGCGWSEPERHEAISRIWWRQTRQFSCCGEVQDPSIERVWWWDEENQVGLAMCKHCEALAVSNEHASFTASKMYSPFITMRELAAHWLRVKDDPEGKQTFYNTQLALPFHAEAAKEVAVASLIARREVYPAEVPNGVLVLTAGIDVQPGSTASEGRIELETVGWGLGEENWSIAHETFTGDPAKPEVWNELDEYLLTSFKREDGRDQFIRAACVDSGGHNTQEAYAFARQRTGRNVWAIKGANDRTSWSPIWPAVAKAKNRKYRAGYRPIILGVSAAKEAIRQRLLIQEPGPGYCHFPMDRSDAWFSQLTSERLMIERKAGVTTRKWVLPKDKANEALDCRVYAYAALWGLYHVRRLRLERQALMLAETSEPAPPPVPVASSLPVPAAQQRPQAPQRVRRSAWMS